MFKNLNVYELNGPKRNLWLKETLSKFPEGQKVLDAGAGELRNKQFCEHLDYKSQDLGTYDGKGDNAGLQTNEWDTSKVDIVCDIVDIPVEDGSFDIILCTEVLEHIPNPLIALKELTRTLKPGGELIITAPFASLTHFAPQHYYSGFNKYFYEKAFAELGLELLECTPNGNYYHYMAQELDRIWRMFKGPKLQVVPIKYITKVLMKFCIYYGNNVGRNSSDILCFGYHVRAQKSET